MLIYVMHAHFYNHYGAPVSESNNNLCYIGYTPVVYVGACYDAYPKKEYIVI